MKGKKVYLRAIERKDIAKAWEYMNNIDTVNSLSVRIPYPMNFDNEMDWYDSQRKDSSIYNFAICTVEDDLYLGGCGINKIDWNNSSVVVGIFIGDDDYKSKGYGTEAMNLLIDFIFNQMNINRIELRVFAFNIRAIKSYLKAGFMEEGRLREAVFRNGSYHDEVVMSILRKEYLKNK